MRRRLDGRDAGQLVLDRGEPAARRLEPRVRVAVSARADDRHAARGEQRRQRRRQRRAPRARRELGHRDRAPAPDLVGQRHDPALVGERQPGRARRAEQLVVARVLGDVLRRGRELADHGGGELAVERARERERAVERGVAAHVVAAERVAEPRVLDHDRAPAGERLGGLVQHQAVVEEPGVRLRARLQPDHGGELAAVGGAAHLDERALERERAVDARDVRRAPAPGRRQLDRHGRVAAPAHQRRAAAPHERGELVRGYRELELDRRAGLRGRPGVEQPVGEVAAQVQREAAAVARAVHGDQLGRGRQHRREADPELADLRVVALLGRAEQHEQLLLDRLARHPAAAVAHRDARPRGGLVVGDLDLDRRRSRVDRVLDQLAIERERVGELRDDLADEARIARHLDVLGVRVGAVGHAAILPPARSRPPTGGFEDPEKLTMDRESARTLAWRS